MTKGVSNFLIIFFVICIYSCDNSSKGESGTQSKILENHNRKINRNRYKYLSPAIQNSIFDIIINDVIKRYQMNSKFCLSIKGNKPEVLEEGNDRFCNYVHFKKSNFIFKQKQIYIAVDSIYPPVPFHQTPNNYYLFLSHICEEGDGYKVCLWTSKQNANESLGMNFKFDLRGRLLGEVEVIPIME